MYRLHCRECDKSISDAHEKEIIVRGWCLCPECAEKFRWERPWADKAADFANRLSSAEKEKHKIKDELDRIKIISMRLDRALKKALLEKQYLISGLRISTGLLEVAKNELAQTVSDAGGCDHSVGICFCGLDALLDDIDVQIAANKPLCEDSI